MYLSSPSATWPETLRGCQGGCHEGAMGCHGVKGAGGRGGRGGGCSDPLMVSTTRWRVELVTWHCGGGGCQVPCAGYLIARCAVSSRFGHVPSTSFPVVLTLTDVGVWGEHVRMMCLAPWFCSYILTRGVYLCFCSFLFFLVFYLIIIIIQVL